MELIIGICDDCMEQIKLLRRYLDKYNKQFDVKVISSVDSEIFLSIVKDRKPGMVFLDIDMEGLDGIELGKKIKEENEDIVIIYITGHEEYALDAFRIRAFHYLIKPLTEEKFNKVFREAVTLLQKNASNENEGTFTFRMGGEIISIFYNDIVFFEKAHHKIKVNYKDKNFEFYGSFKELQEDINNEIFIRCHQGYIVNKNKIRIYKDKTLIMKGNIQIPVSRSNINKVKDILADKLFNGED